MLRTSFISALQKAKQTGNKKLAILIDPDKTKHLESICESAERKKVDTILVGGSLISNGHVDATIKTIKAKFSGPVIIFPGDFSQANENADGILFLSVISGRNPDLLIGKHVLFAPRIKHMGIEVISCGYILVNSGTPTSVEYMSNTVPIPYNKPDIAAATALAGEMLGLSTIYMESGSGAEHELTADMIARVSENISIPLIIGGGIRSKEQVEAAWKAGADMVVVGTAIEQDPEWLDRL